MARRLRFWARSCNGEVWLNRGFGEHKTEAQALAALERGIMDEIEVCQVRIARGRKSLRAIRAGKVVRTWERKR